MGESLSLVNQEVLFCFNVALAGVKFNTLANLLVKWLFHTIWSLRIQYTSSKILGTWVLGLEWPSTHDYTRSVRDELVFIPIIEPPVVKEVESKNNFSPSNSHFFFHLILPLLTQLSHLPMYPTHFAMAKPIFLLGETFKINLHFIIL